MSAMLFLIPLVYERIDM